MSILLSIIIPVFNTERYLQDCLNSIPTNNDEIEIIIIDDASYKKKTIEILNKKKNGKNIKLIKNKINIGVGNTRNIGIKKAKGKYLLFLDSDDRVETSNLKNLTKILKKHKTDLIYCRFKKKTYPQDNLNILMKLKMSTKASYFKNIAIKNQYLGDDCWPFIVNREFLIKNHIFFPKDIRVAEDEYFTTRLFLKIKTYFVFEKTFYLHTEREGSLSSDLSSFNNNIDFINLFYLFINLLSKNKSKVTDKKIILRNLRVLFSRIMFLMLIRNIEEKKIIYQKIKKKNSKIKINFIRKYKLFYLSEVLKIKNYKMFIEMEKKFTKKLLNKSKSFKNIFIYCRTLIAKGLNKILTDSKKKIINFIDDSNIKNKKFEKNKVLNLKEFLSKIKNNKNIKKNYMIFVANNRIKTFNKIKSKLIEKKIPSNKIKQIF